VNTMPEATLNAFADHGVIRSDAVTGSYAQAQAVIDELATIGVSYDDVVQVLEDEGVEKFAASWKELLDTVAASLEQFASKGGDAK
jgi:transaldolase